jgi:integrase
MKNVRTFHIQAWLNEIGGKGLSRNSLKRLKSSLPAIFKLAKQLDYFDGENPARDTAVNPAAPAPVETYAYSIEEVNSILTYLPEPAATAFAIAAYTGLRIGEIEGLRWEDFRGEEIHVSRSIWNGHVSEPKTRKSRAPVPVIQQLADRLEMHRMRSRGAQSGPMFQTGKGTPCSMHNLERRAILPALNRCKQCMKAEDDHEKADHCYMRDMRLPEWHGWHACRRGLGSKLYRLGVPDVVIQRILRHANVATTTAYYIKTMGNDVRDAMAKLAQADLDTSRTPGEEKLKPM